MIVIDSSVVFKWFNSNEVDTDKAIAIWQDHADKKILIQVPDLIIYELANAWATKSKLSIKEIKNNLDAFFESKLEMINITLDLVNKSTAFSKKYSVSVYDAIYAVLAKERGSSLVTADKKFVEKINLPFVKLLEEYS